MNARGGIPTAIQHPWVNDPQNISESIYKTVFSRNCQISQFLPVQQMIEEIWIGSIFGWLFGQLFSLVFGRFQRWADTNVTLAFANTQVIPPLSREETYLGQILAIVRHIWDILGNIWDIYGKL